jgi:flagellar biosynthesis protein FliR
MQGDLLIPVSLLCSFLLVLVRVAGVFSFIPIPASQVGPTVARIVVAVACTIALYPLWPQIDVVPGIGLLLTWVAAEAVLGLTAGVIFSFIAEAFTLGAQVLSLQAGYGYASTIDPTTQADSGILLILAQLMAGLFFFTMGLDRLLIQAFALSLEAYPPGTFSVSRPLAGQIIALGGTMLSLACRIALPITGMLLMVDLALGVLGRINAQVQVGLLSFPLKMMLALIMLAMMTPVFPVIYESHANHLLTALRSVIAPR